MIFSILLHLPSSHRWFFQRCLKKLVPGLVAVGDCESVRAPKLRSRINFRCFNDAAANPKSFSVTDTNGYIYRYHHKLYPVVSDGHLLGCVSLNQVKQIPKQEWATHRVSELVRQCDNGNTIDASADAIDALSRMSTEHVSRLMVVKDEQLVGMVSLKDLLKFLSLKLELKTAGRK